MSCTSRIERRLGVEAFNLPQPALLAALDREQPFRRAYVGGVFDLPHRGHLALLARVRRFAAEVVLSLNTDEFTASYKRRPVMPLADRVAIWSACRLVDRVVVNTGGADSRPAIERVVPDCIVHADDWHGDSLLLQLGVTAEWLAERGIALVILPYTDHVSTSQLVAEALGAVRAPGAGRG